MLLLILVFIIGIILGIAYVERDRKEIQRQQEVLERENQILQAKLKDEELKTKKETFNRIGEAEV